MAWHGMIRRLYDRVLALAASRHAPLWLAVVSFAESSFFPVPPDALLVPMVLARPDRAYRLALKTGSAVGRLKIGRIGLDMVVVDPLPAQLADEPGSRPRSPVEASLQLHEQDQQPDDEDIDECDTLGDLIESRHRFGYRLRAIPRVG